MANNDPDFWPGNTPSTRIFNKVHSLGGLAGYSPAGLAVEAATKVAEKVVKMAIGPDDENNE
jgi:hypothetical protein